MFIQLMISEERARTLKYVYAINFTFIAHIRDTFWHLDINYEALPNRYYGIINAPWYIRNADIHRDLSFQP